MCKGNDDGQKLTSYGALAAKSVPFYVLPQSFVDKNKIKGNSLGAIICDNKMYYAIMGDTKSVDLFFNDLCCLTSIVRAVATLQKSSVKLHGLWPKLVSLPLG